MFPEEFAKELELKNGESIDAAVIELSEEVESHVGIIDFLFKILKEHVKKPRNPKFNN